MQNSNSVTSVMCSILMLSTMLYYNDSKHSLSVIKLNAIICKVLIVKYFIFKCNKCTVNSRTCLPWMLLFSLVVVCKASSEKGGNYSIDTIYKMCYGTSSHSARDAVWPMNSLELYRSHDKIEDTGVISRCMTQR